MLGLINGKKTYICASLIAALGLMDIVGGDTQSGVQKIVEALTAMSVRSAIK